MRQVDKMYPTPLDPAGASPDMTESENHIDIETPILIVGGGPVGMIQALLLARIHGQRCVLIEREPTTTSYPKMEFSNGRSLEIYRAMGLHEEVRALANSFVPEHHSMDELIVTSLVGGGKLVHTWERDSPEVMRKKSNELNDGAQYLEPHMRCHQILLESWLKTKIDAEELIEGHWDTALVVHHERSDHVLAEAKRGDGTLLQIRAQYLIGCDGGGSWVRKHAGLESKREYLNLTVGFAHFRSAALRRAIPFKRFWHANVIAGGVLISQNEKDVWTMHYLIPLDVDPASVTYEDVIFLGLGGCQGRTPVEIDEVYSKGTWRVDVAVANSFVSPGGRVLLAGDAAHQLSPLGGQGLNTGVGDTFDLAWKLSAVLRGWAGEKLLTSYDAERRQWAFNILSIVPSALNVFMSMNRAHVELGAEVLNGDDERGKKAREDLDSVFRAAYWIHNQNPTILGTNYTGSPIVQYAQEQGERAPQDRETYIPTTWPGSRAPHLWLKNGRSTLDELSPSSFNLVDFTNDDSWTRPFIDAAKHLHIPLRLHRWHDEEPIVRKVYERDLLLVRPDNYVAWRTAQDASKALKVEEAEKILMVATGH